MATGPQRARLDRAVNGAIDSAVDDSSFEWRRCASIMDQIATALVQASPTVKEEIGGQTGPAVDAAFTRSADGMSKKRADLMKGVTALDQAAEVIRASRQEQQALAGQPLSEPAPYRAPSGQPTEQDLQEEAQSRQAHADYAAAFADQERRAKEQADRMDRVFEHSTAVMKEIHGVPDPEPRDAGGGGGAGGSGGGGGVTPASGPGAPATGGPHGGRPPGAHGPSGPHGPGLTPYQPGSGGPVPVIGGAAPQGGGTPFEYTPGSGAGQVPISSASGGVSGAAGLGVVGAAGGALGGGMLATGLAAGGLRGGAVPVVAGPGTAASGVRGIGATARSGVSGALGRVGGGAPGAAVGQTPASTARNGSRTGAGSRTGTGSRVGRGAGTAGATGAAGAGGRRGKDDEKRRQGELYDVAEDWVDDEDAAPGVLD